MGISIEGRGWGCWRAANHRGVAPQRLIQALLGCSWVEADRLAGKGLDQAMGSDSGLLGAVQARLGGNPPGQIEGPALGLPESFKPVASRGALAYLASRGFSGREIRFSARYYDLREARLDRDWSYRVIFPIRDQQSRLISWTGRSIAGYAKQRYKTLTTHPDKAAGGPLALAPITNCLLSAESLKGGEYLLIGEGPFDGMNLKAKLRHRADTSCLFGKAISPAQMDTIAYLTSVYERVVLLLDPDAWVDGLRLARSELSALGIIPYFLEGDDDPGELSARQADKLLLRIAKNAWG